jgi:hypothetical protein
MISSARSSIDCGNVKPIARAVEVIALSVPGTKELALRMVSPALQLTLHVEARRNLTSASGARIRALQPGTILPNRCLTPQHARTRVSL